MAGREGLGEADFGEVVLVGRLRAAMAMVPVRGVARRRELAAVASGFVD